MSAIIVDISEFLANPIRTGIQRVVRQLISLWPDDSAFRFACYDPAADGLYQPPARAVQFAIEAGADRSFATSDVKAEIAALNSADRRRPIRLDPGDRVLLPEVFYDPGRVKYYATTLPRSGAHFFPIVFDFMPLFNPEAYRVAQGTANTLMPYVDLIRQARSRAFISAQVRDDFVQRILRQEPACAVGEVIPLGADGLALPKQSFDASRRNLVCIGTLEGKKHQEMVFDAFRRLGPEREGKLQFLGAVPKNLAPWLRRVVAYSGPDVEVVDSPSDAVIVECLRRARATVFVSTNEGFGLPAVESLFCGIPVVAHAGLPALRDIPEGGQVRLTDVTTDSVAGALRRLGEEGEAERLWQGASTLRLQTWSGYARAVVDWVRSA